MDNGNIINLYTLEEAENIITAKGRADARHRQIVWNRRRAAEKAKRAYFLRQKLNDYYWMHGGADQWRKGEDRA